MNGIADISIISNNRTSIRPLDVLRQEAVVKEDPFDRLLTEGGDEFYSYVMSRGNFIDSNLIVLSSQHHYYYDSDDLKQVGSIVVLKKLNRISEIENFLNSHLDILPDKCNFIGHFVNNQKVERFALRTGKTKTEKIKNSDKLELGIVSKFPFMNMIYSYMDSITNSYMSDSSVTIMLEDHGLEVINMTESDGLTFFHAKKTGSLVNCVN